ncbi:hypothetical protein KBY28_03575 [Ruegeria pomeroyi]|uniref:hypothetical protein n=1 Tax=Ruegeria pomeroyi TaxID=89184 RepID=UPI001F1A8E0F|nr:hypothetical protein [Ruegeria pomeroyi]MCE8507525.1 hypothetical protein [Ruegeria pomeroyi]
MTTSTDKSADTARVWKRAAYGGLVVAGVILVFGQTSFMTAVVAGLVAFAAGGYLGGRMTAAAQQAEARGNLAEDIRADVAQSAPAPMAEPEVVNVVAEPERVETVAEAAEEMKLVQPSKVLPGEAELAARKGTWRYEGNSATA